MRKKIKFSPSQIVDHLSFSSKNISRKKSKPPIIWNRGKTKITYNLEVNEVHMIAADDKTTADYNVIQRRIT